MIVVLALPLAKIRNGVNSEEEGQQYTHQVHVLVEQAATQIMLRVEEFLFQILHQIEALR